jgi:hypothetical protein
MPTPARFVQNYIPVLEPLFQDWLLLAEKLNKKRNCDWFTLEHECEVVDVPGLEVSLNLIFLATISSGVSTLTARSRLRLADVFLSA